VVCLDVHCKVSPARECLLTDSAGVCCIGVTLFLVLSQVELGRELIPTGSTNKLSEKLFVAYLHVSAQSEPQVENLLTDVTLETGIKLTMEFVLVFDTAVHVSKGLVTLVTRQAVGRVIVCDGLIVFLELANIWSTN